MSETLEYSRDSFERFGDDFCEEMLSWLSFDDCFAYECVAKQWKRVLFNRQKTLNIYDLDISSKKLKLKLECITKKCLSIDEIYINKHDENKFEFKIFADECLKIIRENFNELKTFCLNLRFGCVVSRESWRLFGEKFGHSLRKISVLSDRKDSVKPLLKLTPNLIVSEINDLNDCLEDNGELFLPQLKAISAIINANSNLKMFAEMYTNSVEKIMFNVGYDYANTDHLFTQLRKFAKLQTLTIDFFFDTTISSDTLNMIAMNCKHLTHLTLTGVDNSGDVLRNTKQKCMNLKRLEMSCLSTFDKNMLTFCPNLVHLNIHINIADKGIFDSIDETVPQLKILELRIGRNRDVTNTTLQRLSRLKHLIVLKVLSRQVNVTFTGFKRFVKLSPNMRQLNLLCKANSSEQIIDAFIDLANRNPKRDYVLSTDDNFRKNVIKIWLDSRGLSSNAPIVDNDNVRIRDLSTNLKHILLLKA